MPPKFNAELPQTGIHVVSATRAQSPNERRLTLGNYTADIVVSKREENLCYFVIQPVGSAEIIEMQRFYNAEDAEVAAERALERWNRLDLPRQTAS